MRHLLEEAPEALDGFARLPRALLILDFDGTIAPFAPAPDAARLEPSAATALTCPPRSGLRVTGLGPLNATATTASFVPSASQPLSEPASGLRTGMDVLRT